MQFLKINKSTTLAELSKAVGERNVDSILAANNLKRAPKIGEQFVKMCKEQQESAKEVSWQSKSTLLNALTGDGDVFETAAMLGSDGWKVFSATGTFSDRLKIPETVLLPDSVDVIGGSGVGVSSVVYKKVMDGLRSPSHSIDPEVFNDYSTAKSSQIKTLGMNANDSGVYTAFKLPWGKITLYSSLAGESVDFPVYPEELSDSRSARYDTMPDTLYQYEPWQVYQSSGPREGSYTFKFHRDMWTGDHRDGKANELIRFCEANCYPRYSGSAVNTSTVTLYVNGRVLISGVMTDVKTDWSGPIGLDDWYLECKLEISITEVSQNALDFDTVKSMSLIGGQR